MLARRHTLGLAASAAVAAAIPRARAAGEPPVKLGVLTDMSSVFSDLAGPGDVVGARLAIEDFAGHVIGRPIELLVGDNQLKADIGLNIATQWWDRDGLDAILDVTNSGLAIAIAGQAHDRKKIVFFSSAATDRLTEDACSGYGMHWTTDSYAEANAVAGRMIASGLDSWFTLVADYAFGYSMQEAIETAVRSHGGHVLGAVRHPLETTDFSAYLLQAQASKAKVVAIASGGNDTVNIIKQSQEFGLAKGGQVVTSPLTYLSDVHATGLESMQGLQFAVPWYWDMNDETRAFSKRFHALAGKMPTEVHAGVYSSALSYLAAVKAVGSTDSAMVLAQLYRSPVNDMFAHGGKLLANGQLAHDLYLVQVKSPAESHYPWDYYHVLSTIPAADAFRSIAQSACPPTRQVL